jgi:hypothetical protein
MRELTATTDYEYEDEHEDENDLQRRRDGGL